jgi:hypothetical protein
VNGDASAVHLPEERQAAPPPALLAMQEGFAASVREPFSFATGRMACRTERYAASTVAAILPRGSQGPSERLSIYNEQYWFRLLTVLQDDFPLLSSVMGHWEFNRLATAYLDAHPSRLSYLEGLPWGLPDFLINPSEPVSARFPSSRLLSSRLQKCAELDLAAFRAFHAPGREPLDPRRLDPESAERIGSSRLELQPWLTLIEEEENLAESRRAVLEGAGMPELRPGKGHWAVCRREGAVEWLSLPPLRFALLAHLQAGESLESACDAVGGGLEDGEGEAFAAGLGPAFAEWTARGWFVHPGAPQGFFAERSTAANAGRGDSRT